MSEALAQLLAQAQALARSFAGDLGEKAVQEGTGEPPNGLPTLSPIPSSPLSADGEEGTYEFGDAPDPSRYFFSEEYLGQLSRYLEADARRYSASDLGGE